jgi:hypothetical protein
VGVKFLVAFNFLRVLIPDEKEDIQELLGAAWRYYGFYANRFQDKNFNEKYLYNETSGIFLKIFPEKYFSRYFPNFFQVLFPGICIFCDTQYKESY